MTHGPALDAATALVDLLVRSTEPSLRDRLVLETGLAAVAADTGAIWRRAAGSEWRPSVERGRRGGRFESERATRRALECPVLPATPGSALVRAEVGAQGVALVLAGALDEEAEDALEALLTCLLLFESADGFAAGGPAAPLPSRAPAGELGRIQHDVRNSLTSLMATRQVLERYGAELPEAQRRAFDEAIHRECERTGSILAQGLTGRTPAAAARVPAAEITAEVLALERLGLERAGCAVRYRADEDARALVPACGAEAWSRILRNLLGNAREAAAARQLRGTIEVAIEREGEGLCLRVEDQAGGFPAVPLPTLFEEGFTSGKDGGCGRGLGVVRALAVAAGGAILVRRRPSGACFEIWMPGVPEPS